ncbi:MAG: sensor histidine kinase [Actinomycetota bacterium]
MEPIDPTLPSLVFLRHSKEQQEEIRRWLRPLGPIVIVAVAASCLKAKPAAGVHGAGLLVSIVLAVFVLAGLSSFWGPGAGQRAWVTLVLFGVASGVLALVQQGGAVAVGLVIAVIMIAPRLPPRLAVLVIGATGAVAVVGTYAHHHSPVDALLNGCAIVAVSAVVLLSRRLRETNRQAEAMLVELEQTRGAEARAAALAERQRVAREMHDVLAHSLSGMLLQLEAARLLAVENPTDPRLPEAIEQAHRLGKAGFGEARRAIGMLRDDELPGPENIGSLAVQFEEDSGIPCHLQVSGAARSLGSEAGLALYRVAQEALTNIRRHATPEHVEMQLVFGESVVRLTVEDVSGGPRPPAVPVNGSGGYGLTGMQERAHLLGGTLTAAATDTGFRVELAVPA